MDWASVVSVAITGVVGIAGVAGALLSVRIASKAENQRLREAEKRRIYAAFNDAIYKVRIAADFSIAISVKAHLDKLEDTVMVLYTTLTDVSLVAPRKVEK